MTAQTGRTTKRYTDFYVDDSAGTLRLIPIDSINGIGLDYEEVDMTAWLDAVKGVLLDTPDCTITITGPFDNTVAGTPPTASGSHTVLSGIVGLNTPLTLDIRVGIRHAWEAGEPQFGITGTTANGFLCKSYTFDPSTGKYTAVFRCAAGSAAPAWGTAAES